MKKDVQRKLGFVLFVMAVFFAGVSLLAWRDVVVMCIAGVVLFATAVFFVMGQEDKTPTPTEKTTEILLADRMAELMRGNEKAEKGVYIAVKKQHEAMESGLAAINEKLEELIKAQESAVKTIVTYNKENAKQVALSEREELAHLREALLSNDTKSDNNSMSSVTDAIREMSHRLYEEIHETGEAMLSELETTADSLDEMKETLKNLGTGRAYVASDREKAEPETVASQEVWPEMLAEEVAEPEVLPAPEVLPESEVTPVIQPASDGLLTQADIEALFADTSEPEAEEPAEEEKKSEDAVAPPEIDLSDPNRTLSAEDIAALVASMGH